MGGVVLPSAIHEPFEYLHAAVACTLIDQPVVGEEVALCRLSGGAGLEVGDDVG